jgi:hypothetical protein
MFPHYTYETLYGLERRDGQRYPVGTPTSVSLIAGGREYPGVIEDISLRGARIRFDGPVNVDGPVELVHSAVGRLRGQLRWHTGNTSGLSFDDAEAAVALLIHCLKQMVPMHRPA